MNKTIVYVDGVFDLFHVGHLNFLKKSKELGNYLIVGVVTDKDVESYKRTPIIPFNQRVTILKAIEIIDEVVTAELNITKQFIEKNRINVVVHGDDDEQEEFFKVPREMGIMKYIPYFRETSTTEIIKKCQNNQSMSLFNTFFY